MSHSFESDPMEEPYTRPNSTGVGIALFDKAFDFYSWYLSRDIPPSKYPTILESLAIFMQIATLSFEGQGIISKEEEKHLVKELSELYEGVLNGMVQHKELSLSLEKMVRIFTDKNIKARLVTALMRLEYQYSKHHGSNKQHSYLLVKEMIKGALEKISSLSTLVNSTLCRELEALHKRHLDAEPFLSELRSCLQWITKPL